VLGKPNARFSPFISLFIFIFYCLSEAALITSINNDGISWHISTGVREQVVEGAAGELPSRKGTVIHSFRVNHKPGDFDHFVSSQIGRVIVFIQQAARCMVSKR